MKGVKRILIFMCVVMVITSIPSFAATTPLADVGVKADNYACKKDGTAYCTSTYTISSKSVSYVKNKTCKFTGLAK